MRSSLSEGSPSFAHIHIGLVAVDIGDLNLIIILLHHNPSYWDIWDTFFTYNPAQWVYFRKKSLLYPEIKQFSFKNSPYCKKHLKLWAKTIKNLYLNPFLPSSRNIPRSQIKTIHMENFSDVFCYNFIGCALKIFRFLNDSRYLSWSLVSYESLVIYKSLVEHRTFVLLDFFVLLDSFVLYNFLSYLRFLSAFFVSLSLMYLYYHICRFLSSGKVNIFSILFSSIFYSINILYQYWSGRFM